MTLVSTEPTMLNEEARPDLVRQLKAVGYKIVHMVPKAAVTTLAKYDEMVRAKDKF